MYLCTGHSPTDTGARSGVTCSGYVTVTAVAAGQSQRFYSGVGIFNWHYLSSPPQMPQGPGVELEAGGLKWRGFLIIWFHSYRTGPKYPVFYAHRPKNAFWVLGLVIFGPVAITMQLSNYFPFQGVQRCTGNIILIGHFPRPRPH
jgi:hypothetical protein